MWSYLVMTLLAFVGVLLMFIILLQKGRGGGLAGAFGGAGGQSAFGTRAGDVFTKITVVLAVVWVILAAASGFVLRAESDQRYTGGENADTPAAAPVDPGTKEAPAPTPPLTPPDEPPAPKPEEKPGEPTEPAAGDQTKSSDSDNEATKKSSTDEDAPAEKKAAADAPASESSPE